MYQPSSSPVSSEGYTNSNFERMVARNLSKLKQYHYILYEKSHAQPKGLVSDAGHCNLQTAWYAAAS